MLEEVSTQKGVAALRTDVKISEEGFLTDDFVRQLINVGEVDILVGLPTYNNAKTVGPVVAAIQSGILQSVFCGDRAAIHRCRCAGSRDGTPEVVVERVHR